MNLPSGTSVFHQPDGAAELLPFRPNVYDLGLTFLPDPPHDWNSTHAAWNDGKFDQWVPDKHAASITNHMRHYIPYHYALADASTVCDAYPCSVMGPTDPNRDHLGGEAEGSGGWEVVGEMGDGEAEEGEWGRSDSVAFSPPLRLSLLLR